MLEKMWFPIWPFQVFLASILVLLISLSFFYFLTLFSNPSSSWAAYIPKQEEHLSPNLSFSLGLKETLPLFPMPHIEPEVLLTLDPQAPTLGVLNSELAIRLKNDPEPKRITLPCQLDLHFDEGKLEFARGPSSFFMECTKGPMDKIQVVTWIEADSHEKIEGEKFLLSPRPSPILQAQEFMQGSPFRILADAKCLGANVFVEKIEGKKTYKLKFDGDANQIELQEKDWLIWDGEKWKKGQLADSSLIARIVGSDSKSLTLEGWDKEKHIRLSLPIAVHPPLKPTEIFHSIRIRSDKQISCMMEKQCLILRCGDWVLKNNGRWKILRKKEEREAFLSGKLIGDLFLFEKIENKQGQKNMIGSFFNEEKTSLAPIELTAMKRQARKEARGK